ncbi:MAG: hypothetical protein FWF77_04900 [Defluviitaleaceae bacterium]|nr:hypothetical protein [Defluviitaleaceae bacterium]
MAAVFYVEYKLTKDANAADFLAASEQLNNEHISKQPGYVSWQQVRDGDTWADLLMFETMQDAKNFEQSSATPNEYAMKFYSFINLSTCKSHFFNVEKSYK